MTGDGCACTACQLHERFPPSSLQDYSWVILPGQFLNDSSPAVSNISWGGLLYSLLHFAVQKYTLRAKLNSPALSPSHVSLNQPKQITSLMCMPWKYQLRVIILFLLSVSHLGILPLPLLPPPFVLFTLLNSAWNSFQPNLISSLLQGSVMYCTACCLCPFSRYIDWSHEGIVLLRLVPMLSLQNLRVYSCLSALSRDAGGFRNSFWIVEPLLFC